MPELSSACKSPLSSGLCMLTRARIESLWMLPNYIALMALPHPSGWQYFAIATVLLGFPYVHAIQVAWTSRNSGDVATRTGELFDAPL